LTVLLLAGLASAVWVRNNDFDYLADLCVELTAAAVPARPLGAYQEQADTLRAEYLNILGLEMSDTWPLNVQYIGDSADLGICWLKKVTFDSRPGITTPCYLFLPKNVTFPVPTIIYVPGSAGQYNYLHHSLMYAGSGMAAIALPQRPHNGPVGDRDLHWYTTGYFPVGHEVWDVVRAIDFLETRTDVFDTSRIGITGRSAGSYHTIWSCGADQRIDAGIPSQGANTTTGMYGSLRSNVKGDQTILYNVYRRDYQQYWGLRCPRLMLIQNGTGDGMNEDAPTVAAYLRTVDTLFGATDRIRFQEFNQGHADTDTLRRESYRWFNLWFRGTHSDSGLVDVTSDEKGTYLSGVNTSLPSVDNLDYEGTLTWPTPQWPIANTAAFDVFKAQLTDTLRQKILSSVLTRGATAFDADSNILRVDDGGLRRRMAPFIDPATPRRTVILMDTLATRDDFPSAEVTDLAARFDTAGLNLVYLEVTGRVGPEPDRSCDQPWNAACTDSGWDPASDHKADSLWQYVQMHRLAAVVGHTMASLRVQDILSAMDYLAQQPGVDPERFYLWGVGEMAVPSIYAAALCDSIDGVVLEDAPDHHARTDTERELAKRTGLLHILRHADLFNSAALLFPRKIVLAGSKGSGYDWTRDLYDALGGGSRFSDFAGSPRDDAPGLATLILNDPPVSVAGLNVRFCNALARVDVGATASAALRVDVTGLEEYVVRVTDLQGRTVASWSGAWTGTHALNPGALCAGTYVVRVRARNWSTSQPVLIR
jgi:dienelactone hydrolase